MKKLFAVVLLITMSLSLTACGLIGGDKTIKVAMVTDVGGVEDASFNQSTWEGLQKASEKFDVEVQYLESESEEDYASNIQTFIDEDYDLILTVGYLLADATYEAALANPEQLFANIDDSTCAELENVQCLMFESAESSYLVGYIAAAESKTDIVGFVLGMSSPMMNEFGYGYVAGALAANPDVTILMENANAFGDIELGKTITEGMIAQGADVVYHAAGGTGIGVIEAAQEAGIKAIGVDADQSYLAKGTVITSAMKRVDVASYDVVKSVVEGTFEAGLKIYDLEDGGVDVVEDEFLVSAETLTVIVGLKKNIISGSLEVEKNQEGFEAIYGVDTYTLD